MADAPPVTVQAAVRQTKTLLTVAYTLANSSPEAVFVSVRTFLDGQAANRRPYTLLRDSALVLSYRTAPLPPGVKVGRPALPVYLEVAAGGAYQDQAEVELPARERHPYADPEYPADAVVVPVHKLVLALEYVRKADVGWLRQDDPAPPFVSTRGQPMVPLEMTLTLDAPLPVLKRTDDFYRW